jgi:hypothetical protein
VGEGTGILIGIFAVRLAASDETNGTLDETFDETPDETPDTK